MTLDEPARLGMRRTQSRPRTHGERRSLCLPEPDLPLTTPPPTAVAILAILKSKTNAFPLSTVILEQYRPPLDKHVIGTSRPPLPLAYLTSLPLPFVRQSSQPVRSPSSTRPTR